MQNTEPCDERIIETASAYDSVVEFVKLHRGHVVGLPDVQRTGFARSPFSSISWGNSHRGRRPRTADQNSELPLKGVGRAVGESGPQRYLLHWPPQPAVKSSPQPLTGVSARAGQGRRHRGRSAPRSESETQNCPCGAGPRYGKDTAPSVSSKCRGRALYERAASPGARGDDRPWQSLHSHGRTAFGTSGSCKAKGRPGTQAGDPGPCGSRAGTKCVALAAGDVTHPEARAASRYRGYPQGPGATHHPIDL